MKRFIRNKLRKWLGITYINNSTVHKDIFWTEIDIINNKLKSKVINLTNDINRIDDKLVRLEQEFYKTKSLKRIDEDISAEVQALKNDDKKWTREDRAYWEYMASYKEDNNDK